MKRRQFLKHGATLGALGLTGGTLMAQEKTGLHVPPEEDPHELTFMQWPVSRRVYLGGKYLQEVQQTIADIANTIVKFEPVIMLAAASGHARAQRSLSSAVELWDVPTEDLWCRDSGPLFARRAQGGLAVSHIRFNGWGSRQVHKRDGETDAMDRRALEDHYPGREIVLLDVDRLGKLGGGIHCATRQMPVT